MGLTGLKWVLLGFIRLYLFLLDFAYFQEGFVHRNLIERTFFWAVRNHGQTDKLSRWFKYSNNFVLLLIFCKDSFLSIHLLLMITNCEVICSVTPGTDYFVLRSNGRLR